MPLRKAVNNSRRKTAYRLLRGSMGGPFLLEKTMKEKIGNLINYVISGIAHKEEPTKAQLINILKELRAIEELSLRDEEVIERLIS